MEEHPLSQPAGYLLSKFGLLAILACLLLAAWNGQIVIVILLGFVLSAAGTAMLWSRLSLSGVSYQRLLSEQRVFPGEYVELKSRLTNRKLLPLPWVQVDDEIPAELTPDISLAPGTRPGSGLLSKAAALLWYSRIRWQQRLYCNKRGYYTLGPVTISSGDIFGFYPRSTTESLIDHIIVYPTIFPISQLAIPSLYPLGETSAERRIFEDPTRVIGVRDYRPDDSLKRIHWKATARHQNLQVKVFDPTTTIKLALFLSVDSFKHGEIFNEEDFELGISTAASVADYITEQGCPVGLFANTRLADSDQPARIPTGSGNNQLVTILEALAKVTPHSSSPFVEFLKGERGTLPWGATLIFILSRPQEALTELFANLKESGYKLMVLHIGENKDYGTACNIPWHNISDTVCLMKSPREIE